MSSQRKACEKYIHNLLFVFFANTGNISSGRIPGTSAGHTKAEYKTG